MSIEDAKKILSGDVAAVSPEILQEAAKIILSELDKAEEKISALEKKIASGGIEDLPSEIWKDIEGFEGFYQVSNKGRVKSFYFPGGKLLKPSPYTDGYVRVSLSKSGKRKEISIHRLVAFTFIPNPECKPEVNHKDGDKRNNCVENLEWVTCQENTIHAFRLALKQSANRKLTAKQVKYIRENYKPYDKNFSSRALAKKFNVHHRVILEVIKGKTYNFIK